MIFYLDYTKAKPLLIDVKEWYERYKNENSRKFSGYSMLQGTPMIVSIEGSYMECNDLLKVCHKNDSGKINKWLSELRNPLENAVERFTFRWNRYKDGSLK